MLNIKLKTEYFVWFDLGKIKLLVLVKIDGLAELRRRLRDVELNKNSIGMTHMHA